MSYVYELFKRISLVYFISMICNDTAFNMDLPLATLELGLLCCSLISANWALKAESYFESKFLIESMWILQLLRPSELPVLFFAKKSHKTSLDSTFSRNNIYKVA